jgi:hypothetical protein
MNLIVARVLISLVWLVGLIALWRGAKSRPNSPWAVTAALCLLGLATVSGMESWPTKLLPRALQLPRAASEGMIRTSARDSGTLVALRAAVIATELRSSQQTANAQVLKGQFDAEVRRLTEENEALRATPEQQAASIFDLSRNLATSADAERLSAAIVRFIEVNPQHPSCEQLRMVRSSLAFRREALKKLEAQAAAEAAAQEIAGKMTEVNDTRLSESLNGTIAALPQVDLSNALKDPDLERGRAVTWRGLILRIERKGRFIEGTMGVGGTLIYFVTSGTTFGVEDGRYAEFSGVFTQRVTLKPRSRYDSRALVAVGYFRYQN